MNDPLYVSLSQLALMAVAATALSAAHAQTSPGITISGFGSAAVTMTDTDEAQFARPNQADGVGKDPRSFVDSNLGIQATATLNERWSVTGQSLARRYGKAHFGMDITLAFVKYRVNDDLAIRVGRLGLPVYMVSDFRSVGYASTMLRPSQEVYSQVVNEVVDGADVLYQHSFGDTTINAQFGYGKSSVETPFGKTVLKKSAALNVIAEHGPFALRLGYSQTDVGLTDSPELDGLFDVLRQVGLGQVADDLDYTDVPGSFSSLGFTMDYQNFLIQSEYAKRKTTSRLMIESTTSYYAMFGYRMGKFTPYYYCGNTKQDGARVYAGLPTTGPLAELSGVVQFLVQAPQQSTHALGMRWDFHQSAAAKVQIDRVSPRDGSGLLIHPTPTFTGPVHVAAVGIDFVF